MSDIKRFNLPDVGEGLTEAEIVTWKVKPGDAIKVNDILVEIETAKSLVELPSPFAGTVADLLVPEGETVAVGTAIIAVSTGEETDATEPTEAAAARDAAEEAVPTPKDDAAVEPGLIGGPAPGGRTSVLVGYGPRTTEAKRRPRSGPVPAGSSPAAAQAGVQGAFQPDAPPPVVAVEDAAPADVPQPALKGSAPPGGTKPLAKPPVRRLARDLGVDLTLVQGSGQDGTITRGDVENAAAGGDPADLAAVTPLRAGQGERETRVPIKGVRKVTAMAMVTSAFTAPHVTEWVTLDATRTMRLVRRLRERREFAEVRVSPLLVVARAVCLAIRRTPELNASWDEAAQEIVVKHYVNLGIAAATPRGLVVPNVRDADAMSSLELATALTELTRTAREGRTQPEQMSGGSFTITNVGMFGVDSGTPILNPGESGILCMGAIRRQPWVHAGVVKPRWVTTLALSFDHRVVDGEQGSRFLADVAAIVEDPGNGLLF